MVQSEQRKIHLVPLPTVTSATIVMPATTYILNDQSRVSLGSGIVIVMGAPGAENEIGPLLGGGGRPENLMDVGVAK